MARPRPQSNASDGVATEEQLRLALAAARPHVRAAMEAACALRLALVSGSSVWETIHALLLDRGWRQIDASHWAKPDGADYPTMKALAHQAAEDLRAFDYLLGEMRERSDRLEIRLRPESSSGRGKWTVVPEHPFASTNDDPDDDDD